MQHQATAKAKHYAKSLRAAMTDAERKVWSHLRLEQLGCKFRRQHPLGPYIADFACLEPKLIVEIDGSQHESQASYDTVRDEFFKSRGFEVLRFATNLALSETESVAQAIYDRVDALLAKPPSQPSPRGGRGKTSHTFPGTGRGKTSHKETDS